MAAEQQANVERNIHFCVLRGDESPARVSLALAGATWLGAVMCFDGSSGTGEGDAGLSPAASWAIAIIRVTAVVFSFSAMLIAGLAPRKRLIQFVHVTCGMTGIAAAGLLVLVATGRMPDSMSVSFVGFSVQLIACSSLLYLSTQK